MLFEPEAKVLPIPADDSEDIDSDQSVAPLPNASPASANPSAPARGSEVPETSPCGSWGRLESSLATL